MLDRVLHALKQARGLGDINLYASDAQYRAAEKIGNNYKAKTRKLGKDEYRLLVHEAPKNFETFWLPFASRDEHRGLQAMLYVSPTLPYLPSSHYEACARIIRNGKCREVLPSRPVKISLHDGVPRSGDEIIYSVRARQLQANKALPVRYVPSTLIESLDIHCHDSFVLASALLDARKIR